MVYTVTCNPALDCTVSTDALTLGALNRTRDSVLTPGGKGINVALVLAALGVEVTAGGFAAGDTGCLLETLLRRRQLAVDFVTLAAGSTRINVKLLERAETELNAPGPGVTEGELRRLEQKIAALETDDCLCLCGSLAPGLPIDTYGRLLKGAAAKGLYTVVDAEGAALQAALPYQPWLIKPNRPELCRLVQQELTDEADILRAARALQEQGAKQVLVSLGGEGALLCTAQGEAYRLSAPAGKACNTVGAGDSMVAGFVAGFLRTHSLPEALRWGVAAGSGTAFSPSLTDSAAVERLLACIPRTEKIR